MMKMSNVLLKEWVRRCGYNSNLLTTYIQNGDAVYVRRLLEAGANVRYTPDDGDTSLDFHKGGHTEDIHQAATGGCVEITRLILEYSSEVLDSDEMESLIESRDEYRNTPLFCAVMGEVDDDNRGNHENRINCAETVELLIQYGADVNAEKLTESDDYVSVLDKAEMNCDAKIVELLRKRGAKTSVEFHSEAEA